MHCAFLRRDDGHWYKETVVSKILDHDGEIVECETSDDLAMAIEEIESREGQKGQTFYNNHGTAYKAHGPGTTEIVRFYNPQVYEDITGRSDGRRPVRANFGSEKEVTLNTNKGMISVKADKTKHMIVADAKEGDCYYHIVGYEQPNGQIICKINPDLAESLHFKRNKRRNKIRAKSPPKKPKPFPIWKLQNAAYALKKEIDDLSPFGKWEFQVLVAAIAIHDVEHGKNATNEILREYAVEWHALGEENLEKFKSGTFAGSMQALNWFHKRFTEIATGCKTVIVKKDALTMRKLRQAKATAKKFQGFQAGKRGR